MIYTCKICKKEVFIYDKGICCHHCNHWIHHKCNPLSDIDYTILQNKDEPWYCIPCIEVSFPFFHIDRQESSISKSLSKPSPSLVKLINQLNNFTEEIKDYDENLPIFNTVILDSLKISQKSLKVNHYLYLILIFALYQRMLISFVYYLKKSI